MSNHPKTIGKYDGTLQELSRDITHLDYDALVELFASMQKDFTRDSIHDLELTHPEVAKYLANIAQALQQILENNIKPMADLCRPYNEKGIK